MILWVGNLGSSWVVLPALAGLTYMSVVSCLVTQGAGWSRITSVKVICLHCTWSSILQWTSLGLLAHMGATRYQEKEPKCSGTLDAYTYTCYTITFSQLYWPVNASLKASLDSKGVRRGGGTDSTPWWLELQSLNAKKYGWGNN